MTPDHGYTISIQIPYHQIRCTILFMYDRHVELSSFLRWSRLVNYFTILVVGFPFVMLYWWLCAFLALCVSLHDQGVLNVALQLVGFPRCQSYDFSYLVGDQKSYLEFQCFIFIQIFDVPHINLYKLIFIPKIFSLARNFLSFYKEQQHFINKK